jgi:hypothetical protein
MRHQLRAASLCCARDAEGKDRFNCAGGASHRSNDPIKVILSGLDERQLVRTNDSLGRRSDRARSDIYQRNP